MDDGILARWPHCGSLSARLQGLLPRIHDLGFEHFVFIFNSRFHHISSGSLALSARAPVQAALDRNAFDLLYYGPPPLAEFIASQRSIARPTDYCHGWVQPLQHDDGRSGLAVLRASSMVSTAEMYEKAAVVLWMAKDLHRAASLESARIAAGQTIDAPLWQ